MHIHTLYIRWRVLVVGRVVNDSSTERRESKGKKLMYTFTLTQTVVHFQVVLITVLEFFQVSFLSRRKKSLNDALLYQRQLFWQPPHFSFSNALANLPSGDPHSSLSI